VDQLDHPARERQRHAELRGLLECGAEEAVHLRLALPDGEIAPDAGLGLRAGAVVLGDGGHRRVERHVVAAERGAVEPRIVLVESLEPDARLLRERHPLGDQRDEHALDGTGALDHLVDVRVHERGGEEEGAVDVLGPLVAPDVVGDPELRDRLQEPPELLHARADRSVELAEHEGAGATVPDPPGRDPVGGPVHEAADGSPGADVPGDQLFVQAVLERHEDAAGGEVGDERPERVPGVLGFHGEQDQVVLAAEIVRRDRAYGRRPAALGGLDREAALFHLRDMGLGQIHQEDVVAGTRQRGPRVPADRACAVDRDLNGLTLPGRAGRVAS